MVQMHGGFVDVGFKSGVVVWKWWNFVCQWNPPVFVAGLPCFVVRCS
jgi:hypothetical protein